MKRIAHFMYVVLMLCAMVFAGCRAIMPTLVPPMTEELGFSVPNYKGLTAYGLVDGAYKLEEKKLELWGYSVKSTLSATETARSGIMDLLTVVGLGGTAAIPAALARVPKDAQKKDSPS